jgi:hypothetical protein
VDVPFERVDETMEDLKAFPFLRTVSILPPKEHLDEAEMDLARQRVMQELPGVEAWGVVYNFDLEIKPATARNGVAIELLLSMRNVLQSSAVPYFQIAGSLIDQWNGLVAGGNEDAEEGGAGAKESK